MQIIADDPVKGAGRARRDDFLITRLIDILGGVEHGLDLASAHFVPGEIGTKTFTGLVAQGRKVRILTNALDTNDVFRVHAGYGRDRRELLAGGVDLYEMKLGGENAHNGSTTVPLGMHGASLHAKTFAVDGERVFIGSFNFDPRSALLNCEMGVLIDSPSMARVITAQCDTRVPLISYRPTLTPEGRMVWVEPLADGTDTIYQQEPGASRVTQVLISVIGLLPVEWML